MAPPAVGPYPGIMLITPGGNPAYTRKKKINSIGTSFAIFLF
jgi:hypothetical protein